MADKNNRSALPSLQLLCETKSLSQILDPNFTASDFTALEPRLQEILFDKLRKENARLLEIEKQWIQLRERCPRTDLEIHLHSGRANYDHQDDIYEKQQQIARKWNYEGDDDVATSPAAGRTSDNVYWDSWSIYWNSESGLYVYDPEAQKREWMDFSRQDLRLRMANRFTNRMSSQLLLYRIACIFGMPPQKECDGYKSCWGVCLRHCSGASNLVLDEHKGAISVHFQGSSEDSQDALGLINLLVGTECLHTYDGIIAGTIA